MSTRRRVLTTGALVAAGGATALVAPEAFAGTGDGHRRTGFTYSPAAVRGWATGDHSGVARPNPANLIFPAMHYENYTTKVEIAHLVDEVLGGRLTRFRATRRATRQELLRVHTSRLIDEVNELSGRDRGGLMAGDETTPIGYNGNIIAERTFAGGIDLAREVWRGHLDNGYMLMRPPGHHAMRDKSMGFCIYNNLAGAAAALLAGGTKRILVVDWDVHTGNGTQDIFKGDKRVVVTDMHQRECFPPGVGHIDERGVNNIINVDVPPGAGHDEAIYFMQHVVIPAIKRHNPEIILVASGFDGGITDPLGRFMYGPATYAEMTRLLLEAANNRTCRGRVVMFHEGGYDEKANPEYGLAVIAQLTGYRLERETLLSAVSTWQQAGHTPASRAALREPIDAAAALVPHIPAH